MPRDWPHLPVSCTGTKPMEHTMLQSIRRAVEARVARALGVGLAAVATLPLTVIAQPESPPRVSEIRVDEALAGRTVQVVLVKDFMRIQNNGATLKGVEFERYLAPSDDEQIVLGRWVDAALDGGTVVPVSVVSTRADEGGNSIQRYRVSPLPARQGVRVTVTSLVARRERPAPQGAFPIPRPEDYPAEVRPFLAASEMVTRDHSLVKETAAEILAKTRDAYGVAAEIARLARERTYLPSGNIDHSLPTAAFVLKHGGSCCASAVAAAAVLRTCGIPAQVTYCPPPSYVHGVVRFWLNGHGWVRMDATSGTGQLPLVHDEQSLALVRLYDTPMEMEKIWYAYAWPYHNNDAEGEYRFWNGDEPARGVRFASHDEAEAVAERRVAGWVKEPFPHLEPGSWSAVLGSEPADTWKDWSALVELARAAVREKAVGPFGPIVERQPSLAPYVQAAERFGRDASP